jgi:hypothetical protein
MRAGLSRLAGFLAGARPGFGSLDEEALKKTGTRVSNSVEFSTYYFDWLYEGHKAAMVAKRHQAAVLDGNWGRTTPTSQ